MSAAAAAFAESGLAPFPSFAIVAARGGIALSDIFQAAAT
jgi:hypothetical protein